MNKPKITFGKIQLSVKKDVPIVAHEEPSIEDAASTSGKRLAKLFGFFRFFFSSVSIRFSYSFKFSGFIMVQTNNLHSIFQQVLAHSVNKPRIH